MTALAGTRGDQPWVSSLVKLSFIAKVYHCWGCKAEAKRFGCIVAYLITSLFDRGDP